MTAVVLELEDESRPSLAGCLPSALSAAESDEASSRLYDCIRAASTSSLLSLCPEDTMTMPHFERDVYCL